MYTVYMHECPNGKKYIGITSTSCEKRWGNGLRYHNIRFSNAIKKYGWDNIKHTILLTGLTKEEARQKEIELIKYFDSTNPQKGYNISPGGDLQIHTEATKKKMSQTRKGRPLSEAHKKALSENRKGMVFSEEHKKHLQQARQGKKLSEEHKRHIAEGSIGKGTKSVIKVSMEGKEIEIFNSIKEAQQSVGAKTASNISSCCKGKRNHAYGYKWKYA